MNAKYSVFDIETEAIIYLLLHNVHDIIWETKLKTKTNYKQHM